VESGRYAKMKLKLIFIWGNEGLPFATSDTVPQSQGFFY
jgi:hypothetical protein